MTDWPEQYMIVEANRHTYYCMWNQVYRQEFLHRLAGKKEDNILPFSLPVKDSYLLDYFYLNLTVREKKKYKKQYRIKCSKNAGRNSFKRYFKGELHYLDEFNFYGMLYLNSCKVQFNCNWGHVRAGTYHSAIVVGEKDGKPVVYVTSWTSCRDGDKGPFRCKAYKLSEVFVFNPKYSYNKRKDKVNDVVCVLTNFRSRMRYRKALYTKSFGTRWRDAEGNYRYPSTRGIHRLGARTI